MYCIVCAVCPQGKPRKYRYLQVMYGTVICKLNAIFKIIKLNLCGQNKKTYEIKWYVPNKKKKHGGVIIL
jgi:hypothetical protein